MGAHPPDRLTDGAIVVRRCRAEDTEALDQAIAASVDHLRPWMAWIAHEPIPVDARRQLIAEWGERWNAGDEFVCAILAADDDRTIIGGCGLHPRIGAGGLEIGYWVRADRVRQGVATAAARLLTTAACTVDGIDRVEIHHDRANVASRAVPRRLGFAFIEERDDPVEAPGEEGVECIWRMHSSTWTLRGRPA